MEMKSMPTGVAVLKWYFILYGILVIILSLVLPSFIVGLMKTVMETTGELELEAGALAGSIALVYGFIGVCLGIFDIFIGIFLGKGSGWARIAAIVVGILSLLSFPLGTVLGVLCLVILFGQEGKAYFAG